MARTWSWEHLAQLRLSVVLHTVPGGEIRESPGVLNCIHPHSTAVYCTVISCGFRKGAGGGLL
jgi:hypothetical protein